MSSTLRIICGVSKYSQSVHGLDKAIWRSASELRRSDRRYIWSARDSPVTILVAKYAKPASCTKLVAVRAFAERDSLQ